jgi:hypothetical protein
MDIAEDNYSCADSFSQWLLAELLACCHGWLLLHLTLLYIQVIWRCFDEAVTVNILAGDCRSANGSSRALYEQAQRQITEDDTESFTNMRISCVLPCLGRPVFQSMGDRVSHTACVIWT